ncbi:hypothetical protein PR202_gb26393 [Eleusine coracana subsp. coracana]|uniref:Alpha/beta hydrolase fold-3 domain-containing protein n=1 Tax=Eleusine coracana subsp. coracana TaxID=191504 RepID=A0AAV5FNT2_ELECO|nr:hypothetical protein PR202_gb26393 [Eleusine coracana subsp. coracana]
MFHPYCQRFTVELAANVLSVQYRLSLPSSSTAIMLSVQATLDADAKPWLVKLADFSRMFVCGISVGAKTWPSTSWSRPPKGRSCTTQSASPVTLLCVKRRSFGRRALHIEDVRPADTRCCVSVP